MVDQSDSLRKPFQAHPVTPLRGLLWSAGNSYIRAGLGIVALQGKVPVPRHNPHGFQSPITDYPAWEEAVLDSSVTGVGIVCTPHLWVLDIDGAEGWEALFERGVFPLDVPTAVSITGRGAHFWFQTPTPVVSRGQGLRFLPHVDLKASGYVVAPPSIHPDTGMPYRWAEGPLVLGSFPYAADAPASLLGLLEDIEHREATMDAPSPYVAVSRGSIGPLAAHLRRADEGERNATLNWCALRAGATGFSLEESVAGLLPVAVEVGLTAKESRATIRSGWKAGKEKGR